MSENQTLVQKFRCCVLQNFPFIEEDFDSLTTYELICKIVEYLNNAITQTNNNTLQIQELTKQFNDLKDYVDNYFADLDVQDEINKKLDQLINEGKIKLELGQRYTAVDESLTLYGITKQV